MDGGYVWVGVDGFVSLMETAHPPLQFFPGRTLITTGSRAGASYVRPRGTAVPPRPFCVRIKRVKRTHGTSGLYLTDTPRMTSVFIYP